MSNLDEIDVTGCCDTFRDQYNDSTIVQCGEGMKDVKLMGGGKYIIRHYCPFCGSHRGNYAIVDETR